MISYDYFAIDCIIHIRYKRENLSERGGQEMHSSSILTLDDNRDISTLITRSLQRCGFSVIGFTDPQVALKDFEMNVTRYVLVISDFRMPGMNGIEFAIKMERNKA